MIPTHKSNPPISLIFLQAHTEAVALVNVSNKLPHGQLSSLSSSLSRGQMNAPESERQDPDPDMQRAKALVELHYEVKMKHKSGSDLIIDEDLRRARADVDKVLMDLEKA
jgi:hypothetical protein